MQKKLKLLLVVASLAISAGFVFIACGDGKPTDVVTFYDGIEAAENSIMDWNISSMVEMSSSSEEVQQGGESSGSKPSSGSDQKSSSSRSQNNSSTSNPSNSSSSASPPKSSSSAAPTVAGCKENSPKDGFKCAWNESAPLTPGKTLKPKDASPSLPSGCTAVKWKYAPGTSTMILNNQCREVPAAGFPAEGSKEYVLFAELTCSDGTHTTACDPKEGLSSKEAPILEGECKWDKNPTTTARGANPTGVTAKDVDGGVCTGKPTVEYRYNDGNDIWPSNGKLAEWEKWGKNDSETYKIEATLKCTGYPVPVTMACPPLEVNGGVEHVIECTCGEEQCQLSDKTCKTDGAVGNKVTLQKDECVEINVYGYNNQYVLVDVGVRCDSQVSSTVTYAGKSKTFQYNSDLLTLGKLKLGDNEFGTVCVTSGGPVTCSGPGN